MPQSRSNDFRTPGRRRHSRLFPAITILAGLVLAPAAGAEPEIRLDGDGGEWPQDMSAYADGQHLYLRLSWPDMLTLQAAPRTTAILLDIDADADTGLANPMAGLLPPGAEPMGIDLAVFLSPPDDRPGRAGLGNGARIDVFDDSGAPTKVSHADVGFMFLPTYAAPTTEVRFSRDVRNGLPIADAFKSAGAMRGTVIQVDEHGKRIGAAQMLACSMPAYSPAATHAGATIPKKPAESVRIISWNVLWGSPMRSPGQFSRVLKALDPDVVLIQEWDNRQSHEEKMTAEMRTEWFRRHMPGNQEWVVMDSEQRGVAIASRHPLTRLELDDLNMQITSESGALLERTPRFLSAIATTPHGDIILASMHLKCCGALGDWADQTRIAEALSINLALRRAIRDHPEAACVIAGDMNLVGSRIPLETLGAGLDTFGVALQIADPDILGDPSTHTWKDPRSRFTPGRLDYVLSAASKAQILQTFILDSARLSKAALDASGMKEGDTSASDHLPVVVDIRLKGAS